MQRRDLLRIFGGAAAASVLAPLSPAERMTLGRELHASLTAPGPLAALTAAQAALVEEISELILPRTDTPGARDVGVMHFIDRILAFWDTAEERTRFLEGLEALDARASAEGVAGFAELAAERKVALLTALDRAPGGTAGSAEAAWARLKSMTVYGYFTSRPVQQDVLRTVILPGRFDGCVASGAAP